MSQVRNEGIGWALAAVSTVVLATACGAAGVERPKGQVDIVVDGDRCTVEPERVVIDYGTSKGYPTKVKFKVRKGKPQRVRIEVAPGQSEPDLFGDLPVFEPGKDVEEKDAAPKREPKWSPQGDFVFRYKVAVGDVICDPEICTRQGSNGCSN